MPAYLGDLVQPALNAMSGPMNDRKLALLQAAQLAFPGRPVDAALWAHLQAAGVTTTLVFLWSNAVVAPPPIRSVATNNANPLLVTKVWFADANADGVSVRTQLLALTAGTYLLQVENDPSRFFRFVSAGALAPATGYSIMTVDPPVSIGTLPTGGTRMKLVPAT